METEIRNSILDRSEPMIEFKRKNLSLLDNKYPALKIGQTDIAKIQGLLQGHDWIQESPAKSSGFIQMSEIWLGGDYYKVPVQYQKVAALRQVFADARKAVQDAVGLPCKIFKAVIDTIDADTCLLPHSDSFFQHRVSLRCHVPIFTTPGALGVNFHPETFDATFWRMPEIGSIYAFNNFEPHTVTKTDVGPRTHLIMDVILEQALEGLSIQQILQVMGTEQPVTKYFSENVITHRHSNWAMRNMLMQRYGNMAPVLNIEDQLRPEYLQEYQQWIKELATHASV